MKHILLLLLSLLTALLCACARPQEQYVLAEDGGKPLTVRVLRGRADGPVIYIVGGVHGDEPAGWQAAGRIGPKLVSAGTAYVLAPANPVGAEQNTRTMKDGRDLNRNFPGSGGTFPTQRAAEAIYADIARKMPVLVLDLHEARGEGPGDDLRGSIIVGDVTLCADLVWALLGMSDGQTPPIEGLALFSGPPSGSLNQAVTDGLGIPVITLETDRTKPLDERIEQQLLFVEFVLAFYGMR